MSGPQARRRDLDVVVFGATGFVGRLVAGYLQAHSPDGVRIGLAGRSLERLEGLRETLGPRASAWPLLVADSRDPETLDSLVRATNVVATTVGPYARYGLPLVEACARNGTSCADLTGEVLFVRETMSRYAALASSTGARLVHSCGFDSVPSDLGVLLLHERARDDDEGELADTVLVVTSMKGGISGGTVDSLRATAEAVAADPGLRSVLTDPYSLSPDRGSEPDLPCPSDFAAIRWDADVGAWVGPFVMASFNTRIVRLSNTLQGWAYGRRFRYGESMAFGSGPTGPAKAAAAGAGVAAVALGLSFGPTRAILDRLLPAPGKGPSQDTRRNGHFRVEIRTRTTTGARYRAVVAAQGDPGYQATSVMLGESALCLALDGRDLPDRSGVLTPATAMGDPLATRLRGAGFTLTVERV